VSSNFIIILPQEIIKIEWCYIFKGIFLGVIGNIKVYNSFVSSLARVAKKKSLTECATSGPRGCGGGRSSHSSWCTSLVWRELRRSQRPTSRLKQKKSGAGALVECFTRREVAAGVGKDGGWSDEPPVRGSPFQPPSTEQKQFEKSKPNLTFGAAAVPLVHLRKKLKQLGVILFGQVRHITSTLTLSFPQYQFLSQQRK
jgi:hypothetical protein